MKDSSWNILLVSFKSVNALFGLIVPDLDDSIITSRDEIRFVTSMEIDTIDSSFMTIESEIGFWIRDGPNFDCFVHACTGKGIWIPWIEGNHHDIIDMVFEGTKKCKIVFEIPCFDSGVIRTSN